MNKLDRSNWAYGTTKVVVLNVVSDLLALGGTEVFSEILSKIWCLVAPGRLVYAASYCTVVPSKGYVVEREGKYRPENNVI